MAHTAHTTRSTGFGFARFLGETLDNIRLSFARQRAYTQTFNQLDALSDHELNDIGLGRSDIRDIARDTASRV